MYQLIRWNDYDYSNLNNIKSSGYKGRGKHGRFNHAIIMLDTETSKSGEVKYNTDGDIIPQPNYIVAFTISIRYDHQNIVTLYGNKPSEVMECLSLIRNALIGDIIIYIHNLPYDWVFLRKFFIESFGAPKRQLCIKSHKPILFIFNNGIILKDSYVLAGRSLEKWSSDLEVSDQKAVGNWDYDLIRQQNHIFTDSELKYIEHDTLAGVECLEATLDMLGKKAIAYMPYTITGIIREEVRAVGEKNRAHEAFTRNADSYNTQVKLEKAFHGGYTHGNRYFYSEVQKGEIIPYDFSSSYPFCMLAYKVPHSKFLPLDGKYKLSEILADSKNYAFLFKLVAINVKLKDYKTPMPYFQFSKCEKIINPVIDNGRLLSCSYVEIYLNEFDASIINDQYYMEKHACIEVEYSYKDYLPRWYTDLVYKLYFDKCTLKNKDAILYQLQKGKLNSLYGNLVQKPCRATIEEDFDSGKYKEKEGFDFVKEYNKYIKKRKTVLKYSAGVWVTSIAAYNLFQLQKCVDFENEGELLYCDTDSAYATKWNYEKLKAYNDHCKELLAKNGYKPIIYNSREFIPGVAELDGNYSEFVFVGAKRYCARDSKTNELKLTVAGVPKKKGVKCLEDDITKFKKGFCFAGSITGKLQHSYIYTDSIYIDKNGNEVGDSIDLNYCNYILGAESFDSFTDYIELDENEVNNFRSAYE